MTNRLNARLRARHVVPRETLNAVCAGTLVLTLDGELPVEYLTPGDRIITRTAGTARLHALRHRRLTVDAVSIAHGTLGNARPDRDVILPGCQEILVRDWRASALFGAAQALVPACRLVDGTYIRSLGRETLDLFELHFETPQILYADGLELASAQTVVAPA